MALIYILEDDTNILEIEEIALRNSGYEVEGFVTAKAFYEAVKTKVPQLVLLDIMLPDADGLSIVTELRKKKETEQNKTRWKQRRKKK